MPRVLIFTAAVYPNLVLIMILAFFPVKVDPLNKTKNIGPGVLSYDRTNKQTDRQTEITTLYININLLKLVHPELSNLFHQSINQSGFSIACIDIILKGLYLSHHSFKQDYLEFRGIEWRRYMEKGGG